MVKAWIQGRKEDDPVTDMLGNLFQRHQDFHAMNRPSGCFSQSLRPKVMMHRFIASLGVSVAYESVSITFGNTRKRTNIREGSVTSLVKLLGTSLQLLLASLWWHVWGVMKH